MKKFIDNFFENNADTRVITSDIILLFAGIMVYNSVFFSLIWKYGIGGLLTEVEGAKYWYLIWPFSIELVLFGFTFLWYRVGKKTIKTTFPDSWLYIIVGSLLYSLEYGVLAYFYRSFSVSVLFFMGPLLLSTLYRSWKWCASTSLFVCTEAVLIETEILEDSRYRFRDISPGINVLFALDVLILICAMCITIYLTRARADREALRAEASNRAKSDFLAMMSHEIRTPINAILGMNEMVLRSSEDKEIIGYSQNIQSSGKVLLSLINDILDFSKIEAGDMPIIPVDYNIGTLIFDCYYAVIKRAEDKGLRLVLKVDEFLPVMLNGDEGRIRQIVTNLLTNAVKYTNEGTVTLKVKGVYSSDDTFVISFMVEDTGIGIAEEDIKNLFTAFRRFDEKTNRNIEGTGLGLAISERLSTCMGGNISVMSEKGKGSVFTVTLPQKAVDKQPIGNIWLYNRDDGKQKQSYKPLFTAPDANVLCVDDVPINLVVLTSMLKRTGMRITTAKNGLEAVEIASKERFDLILMDHLMPNMDGIEALAKIREMGEKCPNAKTPVIILTANAIAGSKDEYMQKGFSDYLSKPIDSNELERVLAKHLPDELKK